MDIGNSIWGLGTGFIGQGIAHNNQKSLMGLQYEYNEMAANNAQQRNKDLWDYTNYENQKQHLINAGLNPALIYGMSGGGGATATGAAGHGVSGAQDNSVAQGAQMGMLALQAQQVKSQIALNESLANKNNADADKTKGVDTELTRSKILTEESIRDLNKANADKAYSETILQGVQENFLQWATQLEQQKVKMNEDTWDTQVKQYMANYMETMSKVAFNKAAAALNEEQRQYTIELTKLMAKEVAYYDELTEENINKIKMEAKKFSEESRWNEIRADLAPWEFGLNAGLEVMNKVLEFLPAKKAMKAAKEGMEMVEKTTTKTDKYGPKGWQGSTTTTTTKER